MLFVTQSFGYIAGSLGGGAALDRMHGHRLFAGVADRDGAGPRHGAARELTRRVGDRLRGARHRSRCRRPRRQHDADLAPRQRGRPGDEPVAPVLRDGCPVVAAVGAARPWRSPPPSGRSPPSLIAGWALLVPPPRAPVVKRDEQTDATMGLLALCRDVLRALRRPRSGICRMDPHLWRGDRLLRRRSDVVDRAVLDLVHDGAPARGVAGAQGRAEDPARGRVHDSPLAPALAMSIGDGAPAVVWPATALFGLAVAPAVPGDVHLPRASDQRHRLGDVVVRVRRRARLAWRSRG